MTSNDGAAQFRSVMPGKYRLFRAPGRVNLIGEHTDYNDGLVMPAAIDLAAWVALCPRADRQLVVRSLNLDEERTLDLASSLEPAHDWSDYIAGVVWVLQSSGIQLSGGTVAIASDIPLGAGLSSSAALEVGVATALLDAAGESMDRMELARACQRAEREFVGARCGLMDQFAVTHGRRDHAVQLDCRSLAFEELPLPSSVRLVVCNTMIKHAHASGGYNQRRAECESALRFLQERVAGVRSLRDIVWADVEAHGSAMPAVEARRVRHVMSENARVARAAAALSAHDLATVGECMAASHRSLRDDFDVSTPELDLMVEIARSQPGVHGARMTGGGFGGCTVNLVESSATADFVRGVRERYRRQTGVTPQILVCAAADAAERVEVE